VSILEVVATGVGEDRFGEGRDVRGMKEREDSLREESIEIQVHHRYQELDATQHMYMY